MQKHRRILVTSALPYANGEIHLGHLLEHIQMDIWARFQRMRDHECITICGSDAHGTPIMINAEKLGLTPEAMVEQYQHNHAQTFENFLIHYDHFHTTHSEENKDLSALIYERLKDKGDITRKVVRQKFDPVKNMFLPDRYVKGNCPRCDAADQYGDNCEKCGASYGQDELKNPYSVLSGATPIDKESEHLFFDLPQYKSFLESWTKEHLQEETTNKLGEWFKEGLKAWDISRDAPYFGFQIPGETGKYFYVWLDAPIGYMASFKKYCENHPTVSFDDFWDAKKATEQETELYHFVGKDIVYFHTLFWPAMLSGANFRTPTSVFVHGFITVQGEKMSKSRGTFITAADYLEHFNPEYLRYYFAAKLTRRVEDVDLQWEDFRQRVNSDLVGKVVNIASRSAKFIQQYFEGKLAEKLPEMDLYGKFIAEKNNIAEDYENREYAKAVRVIMGLADLANQYIDAKKPWTIAKEQGATQEVQEICSVCLNLFKMLMGYLKPILPNLAKDSEAFLNIEPLTWENLDVLLLNHTIQPFKALMTRVEKVEL
jgi:methionyl-tRNA synthetase